jgi:hypothetical protein
MGRNKDLRKRISGYAAMIAEHEAKIRLELSKAHPDEALVGYWEREIEIWRAAVARLTSRLGRDW